MNSDQIDEMVDGYVECALWSSTSYIAWDDKTQSFIPDEDNDQSFSDHNFAQDDIASEAIESMTNDCEDFMTHNEGDLSELNAGQVGHDFWLTRNGHGTGFWDHGLGALGNRLTAACKPYGESDLYMGDDEKLYVQ
jgi:hypothetical protein